MREVRFRRHFLGYSGGHGKVFDYFRHTGAHPQFRPRIHLAPGSVRDGNPWLDAGSPIDPQWAPDDADVLFLAGMDWQALVHDRADRPVINLIQGVRHADPDSPLRAFLSRRAIRICVGAPVAEAIQATGCVNGPLLVIEAGLDLPRVDAARIPGRVFIGAIKQPGLGQDLAALLRAAGHDVDLCTGWIPRRDYLNRLAAADRAVQLPLEREGFYLPGLEAMALGCATVVPDCIGNRAYVRPGVNALCPRMDVDALAAAIDALADDGLRERLRDAGRITAKSFDLERERHDFHRVLDDLDALWRS